MLVEILIERLSKTGEGVGSHSGRAVFVEGALPGERILAEMNLAADVLRGRVLERRSTSPERCESFCPLSDQCGGCDWIHLAASSQLGAKLEIVLSALEHIGGIARTSVNVLPPRMPTRTVGYRRRATLHFAEGGWGYFGRRSHQRVRTDRCPALVDALASLPGQLVAPLTVAQKDIEEVQLLAEGAQTAAAFVLKGGIKERHRTAALAAIRSCGLRGVVLVPTEGHDALIGKPVLRGQAPSAPDISLYSRPDSFTQGHAEANADLVATALELLAPTPADRALELYCGNGNFTFALARKVAALTAVESSPVSLELARRSAREAQLAHVRFIEGDARKVCEGLIAQHEGVDVLLVDPPRSGAKGIGSWADRLGVRKVSYVSCDPASLARDAADLRAHGFTDSDLVLVDMFPQTRHAECAMSFTRK